MISVMVGSTNPLLSFKVIFGCPGDCQKQCDCQKQLKTIICCPEDYQRQLMTIRQDERGDQERCHWLLRGEKD